MFRLVATLLVVAAGGGCGSAPPPPQPAPADRYPIEGQLLGVQLDTGRVVLKHGEVAGYMGAMTMPFEVADRKALVERRPGDLVRATLVVEKTRYYLEGLSGVGRAPLPDSASGPSASTGVHIVGPGDPAPTTELVGHDGKPAGLASWAGQAGVVTFIYTRCPLPDFCPLLDRRFAEIQALAAGDKALEGRVRLLSVSFDPETDTRAVLAAHATAVGARDGWRFATAPAPTVDRFAAEFGVNVIRESDGSITHNLRTAVIGPDGRVAAIYSGNEWTANTIVGDLRRALVPTVSRQ